MIRFTANAQGDGFNGDVEKAIRKALRESLKQLKKDAAAKMRQRYTAPAIGTKPLKLRVAGLRGVLSTFGPRTPLNRFKTQPKGRLKPPPASGIFVSVVRGQGDYLRSAFYAKKVIFQREGKTRLPIEKLFTVSPPGMLSNRPVYSGVIRQLEANFQKNLTREIGDLF